MNRTQEVLSALPDRGWGVLRCPNEVVLVLVAAQLIKVQVTPHKEVFQARLTGAGRKYMESARVAG